MSAIPADHRPLARDLDFYTTHPLIGPGLPVWLPDGAVIRAELEKLAAEIAERTGCQRVYSPVLAKRALYERSGHWSKFAADMFPVMVVGGEEYVLRPANCPHHVLAYAASQRSFRELPVRFSELGAMFRSEMSGVLTGLSRVRQINLDDAHVFCRPDQVHQEVLAALAAITEGYALLGLPVVGYRLSRRGADESYLGADAAWRDAERQLAGALNQLGLTFDEAPGEAAFYGPKIDIQVADAANRVETLSTVQLDFNLPERFDLDYVGADGGRHRPVMIHRGVLGSMERLVSLLVERHGGRLPIWLAPVQCVVLPVSEEQSDVAVALVARLRSQAVRAEVAVDGTLGARVRGAHDRRASFVVIGPTERQPIGWPPR